MTKAELIRRVAKRAGVPDQGAKLFFELFLKKASLQLHPGEAMKMQGLGYFQLKTGKRKKDLSPEKEIYSDFMVFYPLKPEEGETLIFNIPVMQDSKYNFIDSFFSLSFGKPVIPLKDASSSEYFTPLSGLELRRMAEVKTEKLLQEVEFINKYFRGGEDLVIGEDETNASQIEMDWDTGAAEEPGTLSWDFTPELDKQIEEESILDTTPEYPTQEEEQPKVEPQEVSWDFGTPETYEPPESFSTSESFGTSENFDTEGNLDTSETFGIPESEEILQDKQEYQEAEESSEAQESTSTEEKEVTTDNELPSDDLDEPGLDTSWDFSDDEMLKEAITESAPLNYEEPPAEEQYPIEQNEADDEQFPPIEDEEDEKQEEYNYEPEISETDYISKEEPEYFSLEEPEDISGTEPVKEYETVEEPEYLSKIEPEYSDSDLSFIQEKLPDVRKKKGLGLLVLMSIVLLFSIGLYLYIKVLNPNISGKKITIIPEKRIPASAIIERSYDIPVTYPYDSTAKLQEFSNPYNITTAQNNEASNEETNKSGIEKEQNQPPADIKISQENNIITPGSSEKVKEFIYHKGDKYLVQVSSWPGLKLAERHASQLQAKGLSTEIEKAYLNGETWYRVRVGYFNTLSEAETFQKQNR